MGNPGNCWALVLILQVEALLNIVDEITLSRGAEEGANCTQMESNTDLNGRLTPPPRPPPRPPKTYKNRRPLSSDHKRKTSPPVSADSGIFNEDLVPEFNDVSKNMLVFTAVGHDFWPHSRHFFLSVKIVANSGTFSLLPCRILLCRCRSLECCQSVQFVSNFALESDK